MSPRSFLVSPELQRYLADHSQPLDDVAAALIAETAAMGSVSGMQLAPDQGALLGLFTRISGARRALEVGTFTGFSALCIARSLPADGRLLCCDVSEEWTAVARRAWEAAGVADRIDLRIAPALDTLRSLPTEPHLDIAFVDADKASYLAYYEEIVTRLVPGGLLMADNTLWGGRVMDDADQSEDTVALRAFNRAVADDPRTETVLLPLGDGLTVCRRL